MKGLAGLMLHSPAGANEFIIIGNWNTLREFANHRDANESCADLYAQSEERIRTSGKMLDIAAKTS